ncbi:unnamed protein product [Litomosoides sigmodontis]|uniref:Uncharacterized protein n=1 Tax=Litomosoides sigmodontis TaxID=42156 RepID=A0A3P7M5U5_LITSI|nr:unnamed protein product [Litomosoides sigmodontis]
MWRLPFLLLQDFGTKIGHTLLQQKTDQSKFADFTIIAIFTKSVLDKWCGSLIIPNGSRTLLAPQKQRSQTLRSYRNAPQQRSAFAFQTAWPTSSNVIKGSITFGREIARDFLVVRRDIPIFGCSPSAKSGLRISAETTQRFLQLSVLPPK